MVFGHSMDDPLKEFRVRHQSIIEAIDRIQLAIRDYNKVRPLVYDLQIKWFHHLGRQDQLFFAPIAEFHRLDPKALKMLGFLQDDLRDMKIKSLVFFDRHPGQMGDLRQKTFITDFSLFSKEVLARIEIEETQLIPLLAHCVEGKRR